MAIETFAARLRQASMLTEDDWKRLEATVAAEVADAVSVAEAGPWEPVEDLLKDVHTPDACAVDGSDKAISRTVQP